MKRVKAMQRVIRDTFRLSKPEHNRPKYKVVGLLEGEDLQIERLKLIAALSPDGGEAGIDWCTWSKVDSQCGKIATAARTLWHLIMDECTQWEASQGL